MKRTDDGRIIVPPKPARALNEADVSHFFDTIHKWGVYVGISKLVSTDGTIGIDWTERTTSTGDSETIIDLTAFGFGPPYNMVTTDTDQIITALKTFTQPPQSVTPANGPDLATKWYVDTVVGALVGVNTFVGTLNAMAGLCVYTPGFGLPPAGPLFDPDLTRAGQYVICTIAGTIPDGPAAGITLAIGDWLLCEGTFWLKLPFAQTTVVAVQVALGTVVWGQSNVEDALLMSESQTLARVLKSGDTMTGGLSFGSDTVSDPRNLTRHLALWGSGVVGFGMSVTPGYLNLVAAAASNNRIGFMVGTATTPVAELTNGGELILNPDGGGVTFSGGARIYKIVGSGLILRKSSGGQMIQIEDNNGSNRRDIVDTGLSQTIGGTKSFSAPVNLNQGAYVAAGQRLMLWCNTGTGNASAPLDFISTRGGRDPYMARIQALSNGFSYYGEMGQLSIHLHQGGYGAQPWIWSRNIGWTSSLNCSGPVYGNAAYVAPSEARHKAAVREVAPADAEQALSGLKLKRFKRILPGENNLGAEQYGLIVDDIEK
ncbi:MAG: hypothetical protein JO347_01530, partial [Candidatus Eremiobacteraeota bacterium]|nr:hypothetical protein [Candidatus Eremiobacteraeota bacterium]